MFELPTVLAYPLFYKLVVPEASLVGKAAMQAWISAKKLVSLDPQSRMMEVLCRDGAASVTQARVPLCNTPTKTSATCRLWACDIQPVSKLCFTCIDCATVARVSAYAHCLQHVG